VTADVQAGAEPAASWWLSSLGPAPSRPALDGDLDADVAILGAGFTGLWTAYHLLRLAPGMRVAVVEAEHVGFGASGRNGGWCTAGLSVTPSELARRHGAAAARRTVQAMRDTVRAVVGTCAAEGVDAVISEGGILRIARGVHEVPAMRAGFEERVRLGLEDGCALLGADELAERVRVAGACGALLDEHAATVHPGRLVRGLAEVVERRGAVVLESTRVTEVLPRDGDRRPRLVTDRGDVRAGTVVLAGEAFLSRLPGHHRSVLPVYSLIVLTDPLTDAQWEAVGWAGGECLSSHRYTVDYLARTDDGRILFGGRGAPYHYGSGIAPSHDHHEPTHEHLRRQLLDWFPQLRGIRFTSAWGGAVGLARDWSPSIFADPASGIAGAVGYGGQGVATAHLAGAALAHRALGRPSPWDDLPIVGRSPRSWEPEPLRWLAVRYLQGALARIDDRAAATRRAPTGRSLAERLIRH
jgi:glycine/D-amino acid oxidase-like deaminating enzyme